MWEHSDTWLRSARQTPSAGAQGPAGGVAACRGVAAGRGVASGSESTRRGCHGDSQAYFSPQPKAVRFGRPVPSPAASGRVGPCAAAPGALGGSAQRGGCQRTRHPGFRPLLPGAAEVSGGAAPGRTREREPVGRGVSWDAASASCFLPRSGAASSTPCLLLASVRVPVRVALESCRDFFPCSTRSLPEP